MIKTQKSSDTVDTQDSAMTAAILALKDDILAKVAADLDTFLNTLENTLNLKDKLSSTITEIKNAIPPPVHSRKWVRKSNRCILTCLRPSRVRIAPAAEEPTVIRRPGAFNLKMDPHAPTFVPLKEKIAEPTRFNVRAFEFVPCKPAPKPSVPAPKRQSLKPFKFDVNAPDFLPTAYQNMSAPIVA